jgi:hypothetical protein
MTIWIWRRKILLSCLLILVLFSLLTIHSPFDKKTVVYSKAALIQKQIDLDKRYKAIRPLLENGNKMLREYGVPFDPDTLRHKHWRKLLKARFDQMPEMRTVKRPGRYLHGVYLADTLILPQDVDLTGDVFILVKNLIFEGDSCPDIRGTGNLHLYFVNPSERRVKLSSLSRPQFQKASFNNSLGTTPAGYPITKISGGYAYFACQLTITANGADKTGIGIDGITPGAPQPNTAVGATGATGTCPNDPDGHTGLSGAFTITGVTGTKGGTGGTGDPGNNATMNVDCSIPCQDQNVYNWSLNGGRGQKGGPGGFGGRGGTGGKGGKGGPGVACCGENPVLLGKGGTGGVGGTGGEGGEGGNGGLGGRGGNGGTILVLRPNTVQINHSEAAGQPGEGGDPNDAGNGGDGGPGGDPGDPATSEVCGNATGNLGSLGTGPPGGRGANTGSPGGNNGSGTIGVYDPTPLECGEGGGCTDESCALVQAYCDPIMGLCYTPLLIDVFGNGYNLTNARNGVWFDLDGNGSPNHTSWTVADGDDGWLVLDRNGNGTIDSGAELFGNFTPQLPTKMPSGFLALAEYDIPSTGGNGDGTIDDTDSIFSSLRLWVDKNHNGVSEANELFTLPSLGLTSISLDTRMSRRRDVHGNVFALRAKVDSVFGSNLGRWAVDVFLVTD